MGLGRSINVFHCTKLSNLEAFLSSKQECLFFEAISILNKVRNKLQVIGIIQRNQIIKQAKLLIDCFITFLYNANIRYEHNQDFQPVQINPPDANDLNTNHDHPPIVLQHTKYAEQGDVPGYVFMN